ncbi:hypothetical protein VTN02DRAFT_6027 [Thermoascus thermophilus]
MSGLYLQAQCIIYPLAKSVPPAQNSDGLQAACQLYLCRFIYYCSRDGDCVDSTGVFEQKTIGIDPSLSLSAL